MNDTEERVRQTLQRYGAQAPEVPRLAEGAKAQARSDRRKKLAAASGVLVAAVVVSAVWIVSPDAAVTPIATATPAPAVSGDDKPVSQLTGKAVGQSLGLEPLPSNDYGLCTTFAEFENGTGYCLEDVPGDDFEKLLLARQVVGYPRTPALQQWAVLYEHSGQADKYDYDLFKAAKEDVGNQIDEEKQTREENPDARVDTTAPHLNLGKSAETGVTYAYNLDTQCGVEWMPIDGDLWLATDPQGNGNHPQGWGWPKVGLLRLVTPEEALYTDELGNLVIFTRQPDAPLVGCAIS
jgi:hypothetical protein